MTYREILARSERRDETGDVIWPLAFHDRPRGMSASGQDPKGLEAKPASPVRQDAAHPSDDGHRMINRSYLKEIAEVIIGVPVIACMFGFGMLAALFGSNDR
jgi:hypothetical protein